MEAVETRSNGNGHVGSLAVAYLMSMPRAQAIDPVSCHEFWDVFGRGPERKEPEVALLVASFWRAMADYYQPKRAEETSGQFQKRVREAGHWIFEEAASDAFSFSYFCTDVLSVDPWRVRRALGATSGEQFYTRDWEHKRAG